MVVDDEPFNLISAKMLMKANFPNIEVSTVLSGQEAIDIVTQRLHGIGSDAFDFVFMDLNMNPMNGIEATVKMRELINTAKIRMPGAALKRTKVLLHTATDLSQISRANLELFDHVVQKPLNVRNLEPILGIESLNQFSDSSSDCNESFFT